MFFMPPPKIPLEPPRLLKLLLRAMYTVLLRVEGLALTERLRRLPKYLRWSADIFRRAIN
jgi:hypothetical protein